MAVELGTAYLSLVASTKSLAPSVSKALAGTQAAATAAGAKSGRGFSAGFATGISAMRTAALAAVGGVVALGASAVNLEKQFSQTMSMIGANTGAPAKKLGDLKQLALDLGASTSFSATEAADAMLELAKAGLTPATIQAGALSGTLQLAAAGGTSLESAATIAANALNTFNLKGKDMAIVSAALAGGANASTASVESLGEALSQVGPGAKNAGLDINETVGVLAAFDSAGIKGSDAGTSLKTMLANLTPTTAKASKEMKKLGLDFTDAQGNFLPITQVAQQLQDKLGGLSEAQRSQALTTIFGSDATRAATVLMEEGSKGLGKYIKATKDRDAAEKAANARMSGTSGALEKLSGAWETFRLQLGLKLAPVVKTVSNRLSGLIDFLGKNSGVVLVVAGAISAFAVAVLALNVAMKIGSAIMKAWTVATKVWTVVTKVAAVATRALGVAIRFMTGPIGLIITGITLLVGALVWFFTKTKVGKKIIQVVWAGIKAAIKGVADWWTKTAWPAIKKVLTAFGNGFKKAREIISNVWGKISNAIGTAWDWIKKNVFSKISLGLKILRAAFVFYRTKVQQIWNKFKEILKAGWDWVRKNVFDKLKGGLNAVRDRFASIRDRIKGIWTNLRDRLRDGWNWVRDNVFAKFKSGLGNLKDAFINVKNGIRTAWNKLKEIAAKPVNFILGTVYNDGIRKWWNKISSAVGLSGLNLPRASTVKFASGGVLPGYTPGRDVHDFYSPTGGRLSLSGGEAIMRPEFTRAVGGPAGVAALNARARRGEAFADGGVWNWLGGVASGIGRGVAGFGRGLWNAGKMALEVIKDPIGAIKRAVSQIIGGAGTGGNSGDFFRIVGALPSKFAVGLADKVKSLFDSGKGKGASGIFGAGGGGVGGGGLRGNLSAMAAAARALDPSVRVTSGLRPGARTVTGYVSYHSRGRAIDMVSNNMGALWDKLYAAYGKSAPELFYSGRAFSRFGQKGAPRSDHWDHVHWAMANGGVLPKLFDQGGWLPTGTSLVQNNTGKPEPVFTGDQFDRLASRGGDTYHIHGVDEASVISGIERVHRRAAVRNNMYGR